MEQFWRASGVFLGKRFAPVLAVVAVLAIVLAALGLPQLEFATGQDSYLNSDSQIAVDNEKYQELFGGETMILLFTAQPGNSFVDLFGPESVAQFEEIEASLGDHPTIEGVVTPLSALRLTAEIIDSGTAQTALLGAVNRDPDGAAARGADLQVSAARLGAIPPEQHTFDNPAWIELLLFDNTGYTIAPDGSVVSPPLEDRRVRTSLSGFFPDLTHSVGGVVFQGNASLEELAEGTDLVLDEMEGRTFPGFDVTTTGSPVYLTDLNNYLQGGMLTLGGIAVLVMLVVLWFVFRVRWRLLPLVTVLIGVLMAFSLLSFLGISLSLVTISGLPILIGMGVDFAIQVHNRVEEEVVLDQEAHPMSETLAHLGPPMIIAVIAAVVAFLSLRLSEVPMIRDFGVLLAVGIVVLLIIGIVVPTAALGIREYRSPTTERADSPRMERMVVALGSLPQVFVIPLIVLSVGVLVGGVLLEDSFEIQSDPIKWVDPDSRAVRDITLLEDEVGVSSTLGVLIESRNVVSDEMGLLVWDFVNEELIDDERIASISSIYTTTGWVHDLPLVDGANSVPPVEADMRQVLAAADSAVPAVSRLLVNDDLTAAQLNLRLAPSSLEERSLLVDDIQAKIDSRIADADFSATVLDQDLAEDQPAVRATPSGLAVVGVGLLDNLKSNRAVLTYLALTLASLWLVLRFRSVTKAVLALVPVLLAVGVSSLVVALTGLKLSPLTTVSGPLVIATCAEFSVLILVRYLEERRRGLTSQAATDLASARTGRAFVASALTTIGGFAVLIFSALPLLRDFGIIVTLNVAVALLSALVVLPPMLVWADDKGFLTTGAPEGVRSDGTGPRALAAPEPKANSSERIGAATAAAVLLALALFMVTSSTGSDDRADDFVYEPLPAPADGG